MKIIELRNTFHNTSIRIRSNAETPREAYDEIAFAAHSGDKKASLKLRKINKALCGMKDCKCGTLR